MTAQFCAMITKTSFVSKVSGLLPSVHKKELSALIWDHDHNAVEPVHSTELLFHITTE
jgi:hypothetical protein